MHLLVLLSEGFLASLVFGETITITEYPGTCSALYTSGRQTITFIQSTATITLLPSSTQTQNYGVPFMIEVHAGYANQNQKQRDLDFGYLTPNGTVSQSLQDAGQYDIDDGKLFGHHGQLFSVANGVPNEIFTASPNVQSIDTLFEVMGGVLTWKSAAFDGGLASFYMVNTSHYTQSIIAYFDGQVSVNWMPVLLMIRPIYHAASSISAASGTKSSSTAGISTVDSSLGVLFTSIATSFQLGPGEASKTISGFTVRSTNDALLTSRTSSGVMSPSDWLNQSWSLPSTSMLVGTSAKVSLHSSVQQTMSQASATHYDFSQTSTQPSVLSSMITSSQLSSVQVTSTPEATLTTTSANESVTTTTLTSYPTTASSTYSSLRSSRSSDINNSSALSDTISDSTSISGLLASTASDSHSALITSTSPGLSTSLPASMSESSQNTPTNQASLTTQSSVNSTEPSITSSYISSMATSTTSSESSSQTSAQTSPFRSSISSSFLISTSDTASASTLSHQSTTSPGSITAKTTSTAQTSATISTLTLSQSSSTSSATGSLTTVAVLTVLSSNSPPPSRSSSTSSLISSTSAFLLTWTSSSTSTATSTSTTTSTSTSISTSTSTSTSTSNSNYLALSSPTACSFGDPSGTDEDDSYCEIDLPAAMSLYDASNTRTFASTNGFISLAAGSANYQVQRLPTPHLPPSTVAPFFDDLFIAGAAMPTQGIFYQANATGVTYEYYLSRAGQTDAIFHFAVDYAFANPGVFTFRYLEVGGGDDGQFAAVGMQGETMSGTEEGTTFSFQAGNIMPGMVIVCNSTSNSCTNSS